MKKNVDPSLVKLYIDNKCTEEEIHSVENWLCDPSNKDEVKELMATNWEKSSTQRKSHDLDYILKNLYNRIDETSEEVSTNQQVKYRSGFSKLRIAAVLLVLFISAGVFYLSLNKYHNLKSDSWQQSNLVVSKSDEVSKLTLPDGTTVWLNSKSSLKYATDFNKGNRNVFLKGEAYFDVKEDKNHPFIVYTDDISVKVFGTAFTVKAYEEDETSEAILVRGSVQVEKNNFLKTETVILKPNERIVFERKFKKLSVSQVNANNYVTWKDGTLRFENEPLKNALRMIERRYNVTIILRDAPDPDCKLSARIEKESLQEMLALIKIGTEITYTVAGNKIYIDGKMCN